MKAIITDHKRPGEDLLKKFEGMPAALAHEALGKRGALTNDFKPIYSGAKFTGVALTIKGYPGDNLMLHRAISIAHKGDVMIATVNGFTEAGLWGEIASEAAKAMGIQALVTDGAVRDVDEIEKVGFPVFSRAVSIKGTTKKQAGLLNHPIEIGGVYVKPGDIVVGDTDGVCVIPLEEAGAVLKRANEITDFENSVVDGIRAGKLTIDLLGLRPALKELGLDD